MNQNNDDTSGIPGDRSAWVDSPEDPHRIENHVKVYLHLEESFTQPVVASPDGAPAGTRVYRRTGDGRAEYGTVTGWTSDASAVFLALDQGGTYSGPTFGSVYVAETNGDPGGAGRWVVSGVSVDGYPLDGVDDGHYCPYEGHPPGARPDWDRQHREAEHVRLPTAAELLPILAAALGRSIDGPAVDQLRATSDLLAEHAEWRAHRSALAAAEASGDFPASSDWHDNDDAGCDLADRAIALLAELTGQASPTDASVAGRPTFTGAALQHSMLQPASTPGEAPSLAPPASEPPNGPGR